MAKGTTSGLEAFQPADYNPRTISDKAMDGLRRSIATFGDLSGIVFNKQTGALVCGHQRRQAIIEAFDAGRVHWSKPHEIELGHEGERFVSKERMGRLVTGSGAVFAIREVDWPAPFEKAANVAANDLRWQGEWDQEALQQVIADIRLEAPDLDEAFDLGHIIVFPEQEQEPGHTDPDDAPKAGKGKSVSQAGEVYALGHHLLGCGDCQDEGLTDRLLAGRAIDMIFTDPPYGVSYAGKNDMLNKIDAGTRIQTEIEGDHMSIDDVKALWIGAFKVWFARTADYNAIYICTASGGGLLAAMIEAMAAAEAPYKHILVWAKNQPVLGRSDYMYRHELLMYGWHGKHRWFGKGEQTHSVWTYPRPRVSDLHPTMKPVELIVNALRNSSEQGMLVADPFTGSGSTLLACQMTGRNFVGTELDPHYCDVIRRRWAEYTVGEGCDWVAETPQA